MQKLSIAELMSKAAEIIENSRAIVEKASPQIRAGFVKQAHPGMPEKLRVIGIDGGMVKRSYAFFDVLLLRSVGVEFSFVGDRLADITYHPSSYVEPKAVLLEKAEDDLALSSSLLRELEEKHRMLECARCEPDILMCHGSLIPHNLQIMNADGPDVFKELVDVMKRLFGVNRSIVCGVVEDSRGRIFGEHVRSKVPDVDLPRMPDAYILLHILNAGERTICMDYTCDPKMRKLFSSYGIEIEKVNVFYLKAGKLDIPLRVEFVADENKREDIASFLSSVLLSLVTSSSYSLPSVLIEADMRARIKEDEAGLLLSNFESLWVKRRRDRRPV